VINDSNESLVNVYRVIRDTPEELVGLLAGIQSEYHALQGRTERRDYFMEKRRVFNEEHPDGITRAALFIFFMRTCYNGIYSVNRKGRLSVTFGTGSRARILEEELIHFNHKLLQGVVILDGDYRQTENTRERNRSSTSTRPTNPSTRPVPVPPTCRTTSMTTAR
jgi:Site-specific DNA methylase